MLEHYRDNEVEVSSGARVDLRGPGVVVTVTTTRGGKTVSRPCHMQDLLCRDKDKSRIG